MDKEQLVKQFASLLGNVGANEQQAELPDDGWVEDWAEPLENIPGGTVDSFNDYEEIALEDGRLLRRYMSGSVRVENPTSGVIQEEKVDGSMIISLPDGKVLFQEFRGEPLLLYDTEKSGPPGLARVSSAQLPGETQPRFVFHFQDGEIAHMVELESLRYYRLRRA
ncbi:MAG: hypothetical protein WC314_06770 [Vulcanimicrobiota bacterium]